MRREKQEITDTDALNEIISSAKVCRLGLSDGKRPYIVPLCFGYKDKTLYFHSAAEGKKIEIIKKNPRVCFEFESNIEVREAEMACSWGMEYQTIIGSGKVSFIESNNEKREALSVIMNQYTKAPFTLSDSAIQRTTVFKVIIDSMTGKKAKVL